MKVNLGDEITVWVCHRGGEYDDSRHFLRDGILTAIGSSSVLYVSNGTEYTADKKDVFYSVFPEKIDEKSKEQDDGN